MLRKIQENSLQWLVYGTADGLVDFGDFLADKGVLKPECLELEVVWRSLETLLQRGR